MNPRSASALNLHHNSHDSYGCLCLRTHWHITVCDLMSAFPYELPISAWHFQLPLAVGESSREGPSPCPAATSGRNALVPTLRAGTPALRQRPLGKVNSWYPDLHPRSLRNPGFFVLSGFWLQVGGSVQFGRIGVPRGSSSGENPAHNLIDFPAEQTHNGFLAAGSWSSFHPYS
jgi:hypothetical protein